MPLLVVARSGLDIFLSSSSYGQGHYFISFAQADGHPKSNLLNEKTIVGEAPFNQGKIHKKK